MWLWHVVRVIQPKGEIESMKARHRSILAAMLIVAATASLGHGEWTYTLVDQPGASWTSFRGISGNQIIGESSLGAFIYDGTNWTGLQAPGATFTHPSGISGNRVVGTYQMSGSGTHGFMYDGGNWTTFDVPGVPRGIDGDLLVGSSSQNRQGFVYNLTTSSTTYLMAPDGLNRRGTGVWSTTITDVSNDVLPGGSMMISPILIHLPTTAQLGATCRTAAALSGTPTASPGVALSAPPGTAFMRTVAGCTTG
jgi:hypothetical protein